MSGETLLVLSGEGMPPSSVRGITQSLEPIEAAKNQRRTVNGGMVSLSSAVFLKYKSTIQCADLDAPAFDQVEVGDVLTVDCVAELAYRTASGSGPSRAVVTGSSRDESSGFTFYRPQLTMVVVGKRQETNEYGAEVSWSLDLEEE